MATTKVRYKGIADVRVISVKDAEGIGINTDKDLVWDASNGWALDLDGLSDEAISNLRKEEHFSISTPKDDGSQQTVSTASNPDKQGDVLRDATTGATTTAKS